MTEELSLLDPKSMVNLKKKLAEDAGNKELYEKIVQLNLKKKIEGKE